MTINIDTLKAEREALNTKLAGIQSEYLQTKGAVSTIESLIVRIETATMSVSTEEEKKADPLSRFMPADEATVTQSFSDNIIPGTAKRVMQGRFLVRHHLGTRFLQATLRNLTVLGYGKGVLFTIADLHKDLESIKYYGENAVDEISHRKKSVSGSIIALRSKGVIEKIGKTYRVIVSPEEDLKILPNHRVKRNTVASA